MVVCFGIYDLNDDGYISREEMFQMLKNTMVKQPTEEDPDEGIKDLVETMIKRMVRECSVVPQILFIFSPYYSVLCYNRMWIMIQRCPWRILRPALDKSAS